VTRFQFVVDHRDAFEVKRLCQTVEVSRSSFYAWEGAAPARAARAQGDRELAERIRVVHAADRAYGAPRITAELNDGAPPEERVNRKRVARVMAAHGIAGIRLRRRVRTTLSEPADQVVSDLLERDFTTDAPNRVYVGDITYLPCGGGRNLYLATVIDCFSRRLVGWSIADHMRTELVSDALTAAAAERGSLTGAIFHSDHGGQGGFNWSTQHLDREVWRWPTGGDSSRFVRIGDRSRRRGGRRWHVERTVSGSGPQSLVARRPRTRRPRPVCLHP
jgi:hypothetical protein